MNRSPRAGGAWRGGRATRWLILLGLILLSTGCIQRRLVVRSQPEGALVTIDRRAVGHTPVSVPFTYYGTRQIQLEKDGYRTVQVKQRLWAPWYAWPPLSLISENFLFRKVRDERIVDFQLEPLTPVNENLLLNRATQLRSDVQRGTLAMPLQQFERVPEPAR